MALLMGPRMTAVIPVSTLTPSVGLLDQIFDRCLLTMLVLKISLNCSLGTKVVSGKGLAHLLVDLSLRCRK